MSVLQDLTYIAPSDGLNRRKKTNKRLMVLPHQLDAFAKEYRLRDWQKELVREVDINRRNFSEIARSIDCSRQYVSQEYDKIYHKVIDLGYKIPN